MCSQFTDTVVNSFVYADCPSHCMLCELVILLDHDVCNKNFVEIYYICPIDAP